MGLRGVSSRRERQAVPPSSGGTVRDTATARRSTTGFTVEGHALPRHVSGRDSVERKGRINPVADSPLPSEVQEAKDKMLKVLLAASFMSMNPPRRNEPGPGGSDPASGVS